MYNQKAALTYKLGGDLEVNRQGYGAMQLNGFGVYGESEDRENAKLVLQEVIKAGVNFIDTAYAYGPELNESLIGEALYAYPDNLVVATKGGATLAGPNQWVIKGNPEFIHQSIEGSLSRLKLEKIDLWQLHRIDPNVPVKDTLAPVIEAVNAGKIRHFGLSEVTIDQIEMVSAILPVVSVQNLYNLADRQWENVAAYTAEKHIAFIPWYPLASGPHKVADRVRLIAQKHKATTAQVALAWLLRRWPHTLLIPGTKSFSHMYENLEAGNLDLTEEDIEILSKH
jgi:pyridoxine 4-dehydrogenase